MRTPMIVLSLALAAGLAAAEPALAKSARTSLAPVAASALEGAKIRVRVESKNRGRAEVRIDVERAATGLTLQAWVADAAGTLAFAGDFVADRRTPGEYRFRVRTDKGGSLPGGAATAANLTGRAVEIRDAGGSVLAAGTIPASTSRTGSSTSSSGTTGADDDHGGNSGNSGTGGGGRGRGRDDGPNHP